MAHGLKYILQYSALGTNTFPFYQYKILQDSAKWDVLDGPMFLEADGDEPTTHELFESQGPIKPSSLLLNLVNRRYAPAVSREIQDVAGVHNAIDTDGSGDLWSCGDAGLITIVTAAGGGGTQATPGTEKLTDIVGLTTDKLVCVGEQVIYHTSDGGVTWTASVSAAAANDFLCVDVSKVTNSVVWAGGDDGAGHAVLVRSTDSGVTWTDISGALSGIAVVDVSAQQDTEAYIIDGNDLFRYSTTGPTATLITTNVPANCSKLDFFDTNHGIVIGIIGSFGEKVSKTIDGGTTWSKGADLPAASDIWGVKMLDKNSWIIGSDTTNVLIYLTDDWGANYRTITKPAAIVDKPTPALGNNLTYDTVSSAAFYATIGAELGKAVVTDYLREFTEIDFAEYLVTLQRSTTDFETGGGTQSLILNQAIIDSEYGYAEDWATPVNGITSVRVTDGFNIWNSLEYRTSGGALQTGRKKLTVLLGEAFELIYSGFGTTDFFNTYVTYLNDSLGSDFASPPTDATNPFVNGFVDAEYFLFEPTKPWTWWDVVSAILTDYDCALISNLHVGANPQIIANDRFFNTVTTDSIQTLKYITSSGAFSTGPVTSTYVRDLNTSVSIFQGQYQVREKPYQFIEATIVDARPVSIVPDYNFELEAWSSTSALNNWIATNLVIVRSNTTDSDNYSDFSCNITSEAASLGEGDLASIKTGIPSGTTSIFLQIKYRCDVSSSAPAVGIEDNPNFYIQVKYGDQFLFDGTTLKPDPSTHTATANVIDYSGLTWSSSEAWVLVIVSGDNMDSFVTLNLGEITSPAGTTGDFQILISEPVNAEYTINNFFLDEFYLVPLGLNGVFYEDIRVIGENTAISNGKRLNLGELHFYDYPQLVNNDFSSAVLSEVTLIVDPITPPNDGDFFSLDIDGVSSTYTFRTSSPGANEWTTQQDLIDEIYRDSNNYFVWESDGINQKITLHALDYVTGKNFGVITASGAALTIENQADFTAPTTSTHTNRATITDDAATPPTNAADWTWHAVTQETTGTEDTEMWKLKLERELARRGLSRQFIQGTYKILAEPVSANVYGGGIMGLLPPSTLDADPKNYRAISTRGNPFMGEWEILHEKVHDESVTFIGEEVFEE